MGILLGLTAALCWGVADFVARVATQRIGTYRTLFFMQFFGLVGLGAYLIATGILAHLWQSAGWSVWMWAVLVALLNVFNNLALYRSFEIGVLAIVSPIAASSSALTVLLAFISGETVSQARAFGIGAALLGVVLAATHSAQVRVPAEGEQASRSDGGEARQVATGSTRLTRGVGWALAAAVGYGLNFWLLGFLVTPALGGIAPIWLIRVFTLCVLGIAALPTHQSIRLPRGGVWWLIITIGILDTAAFVSAAIGFTTAQVSVVSVLASMFSTITVLLAWIFLREKLQRSQWFGIMLIFLGIVMVKL